MSKQKRYLQVKKTFLSWLVQALESACFLVGPSKDQTTPLHLRAMFRTKRLESRRRKINFQSAYEVGISYWATRSSSAGLFLLILEIKGMGCYVIS